MAKGLGLLKKLVFFVVVGLNLALNVCSTWVNYGIYQSSIPSYTYPLTVNAGDQIVATLSWPNSEDLDVYLYR